MYPTVDEAIEHVAEYYDASEPPAVLSAEVKRLRAENGRLLRESAEANGILPNLTDLAKEWQTRALKAEAEYAELLADANYAKRLLKLSPDTPVLKEHARLDMMWQELVRDRDSFKKETAELHTANNQLHAMGEKMYAELHDAKAELVRLEKHIKLLTRSLMLHREWSGHRVNEMPGRLIEAELALFGFDLTKHEGEK